MPHTMPAYNEPLTALRDRSGMTQYQLAAAIGVSHSSWQKYEYGIHKPRPKVAARIETLMMKYPA